MTKDSTLIKSPMAAAVVSVHIQEGDSVALGSPIATLESMKMQTTITADHSGIIDAVTIKPGETIQAGTLICSVQAIQHNYDQNPTDTIAQTHHLTEHHTLTDFRQRQSYTLDESRQQAVEKRHAKNFRSARENLNDLVDTDSFIEYGQFAIAAQRKRRPLEELLTETAADGIITGTGSVNGDQIEHSKSKAALIVNDYSVLAGTQGYFHHKKLDRILEVAHKEHLPVIMYTEGGGGRPGDTDVKTVIAGLNVTSFAAWAELSGVVPRIAVNNGYCFAGNAALFGCADIRIATRSSSIGMAGPAMIEGGGLGSFKPSEIGPIDTQSRNGVVDIIADDEAHATLLAKQVLSYFQGPISDWHSEDQTPLNNALPDDRRYVYDIRSIIQRLFDQHSFIELKPHYGTALITGFARIEGRPVALLCNDCKTLGGAIDGEAASKAARFLTLCNHFNIPLVALGDTPGFMVGPESEAAGAVRQMSELFIAGAQFTAPMVAIFLRKGYGLGAMAMTGGGFLRPTYTATWPTGEFGAMGLEGAVRLGFKKELEAIEDPKQREDKFNQLVTLSYEQGKATEAAAYLELDAVIEPANTRKVILNALRQ